MAEKESTERTADGSAEMPRATQTRTGLARARILRLRVKTDARQGLFLYWGGLH
jgi:hypothetical protein